MSEAGPTRGPAAPLRRSSAGTLHHQLYLTLADMIRSGEVQPGERMPTEAGLVAEYGVSRTTARRALDELRRQGVVERQPGRGTFVLHPRLQARIPGLRSITDEIEHLGYRPGTVPVSVLRIEATDELAEQLQLNLGDPVLAVKRVRTADGNPVFVSESMLNITRFPGLQAADFAARGLYQIFTEVTGRPLARAVQWLSAVPAVRDIAMLLGVKTSAPVLKLERIVYVEGDIPIESATGYFHGQLYKHYSEAYPALASSSPIPERGPPDARVVGGTLPGSGH